MDAASYPCGHARTSENTYIDGRGGWARCRTCQIAAVRADRRRRGIGPADWLQRRVLAALRAHPDGLRVDRLHAKIGYRSTRVSLRAAVGYMRRTKGVPVALVREGNRARYVLREGEA